VAKIAIQHQHTQPEHAVRAAVDLLAIDLKKEYDIISVWHGHTLSFHRSGASGTITLHPHQVHIDIKLSMMLSMFERKIRETINAFCTEKLP
jgi:putative polyhydroxyalkanoate system protein